MARPTSIVIAERTVDTAPEWATWPDFAAFGLSYRRFDYWTRYGYLRGRGDEDTSPGSGFIREYPRSEVDVARWMVALIDSGLILMAAAEYARDRALRNRLGRMLLDDEPSAVNP